jgi:hypothetical protein
MAGTVVQGNVGTEEVLPSERVVDMDEKIRLLDPDSTQYTTMTSRASSRQAVREIVNWLEEELFPNVVSSSAALAGDAAINLSAGQGKIVAANDILRNMRSGEAVRVVSVATDAVTIARGINSGGTGLAVNANDAWLVVGDAQPQGSDFPSPRYLARVLGFNYTQITRTTWGFTGTQTAIELYGGREPAKEARRKAIEHKRKWENIGFFGARSFQTAAAPENEPRGTAGGLIEFITTNRKDVAGALTPDIFDNWVSDVFANGTDQMSKWSRTGMGGQFEAPDGGKTFGVKVDAFISGAYGYRIPVIVKKEWSKYPNANSVPTQPKGYGSYAFLVDMSYVERRPLRDRDTKLLVEQQPKGKDSYNAEYMTEATWEVAVERAHGILYGVTGGSLT